ncbi:class I SAM-dependent methyltransferase [Candidatus Parcubacteria bacterium]|nr:MAG: class I SAM-dependent methyltransferase [Candidatus Parcubacteria bacterium]
MRTNSVHSATFAHPRKNIESFGIRPGSLVADFGAGSGHYTLEIAKVLGDEGGVYAIDVQQDLLRRIDSEAHRKGLTNVHTIWGDISRHRGTKLRANSVDIVLMSNVLFQLEHPQGAFEEAHRILTFDGTLIVIDWSDSFRSLGPIRSHVFDKERAAEFADATGFRVREQFYAGAHHFGLIFHKK